jgi:6-phosphogluconolactonase (cycloisomerase 2 family)
MTPLRTGYTAISATSGTLTANTGFTVIAEPRYLYFSSDAGRLASKAVIDANSGLPRMAGYIQSGANNYAAAPCPTVDPSNQYLYVGTILNTQSPSGEFQSYGIDPASGALSALSAPFDLAGTPVGCIDFEPTGKFAFSGSPGSLLTLALNPSTGVLNPSSPMSVLGTPTRAALDPLGRYLYVSSFSSGNTAVSALGFVIDSSSGTLTAIPGTPFALPNTSGTFTFHPSGNYVYMANTNGYSIDTYSVSRATGALTLSSTMQTCINPTALRFSPDGAFAYTTCSMDIAHDSSSMSIESFAVGANGALTHLGSTLSGLLASDLTVDPSGQCLYLSTIYPEIMASKIGTDGVATAPRTIGVQPNSSLSNVVVGGTLPVKYTRNMRSLPQAETTHC